MVVAGVVMLIFPSARLLPAASRLVVRVLLAIAVTNSTDALPALEPSGQSGATSDWPQWRGPDRDGTVVGFSIPDVWPESLDKLWSVEHLFTFC